MAPLPGVSVTEEGIADDDCQQCSSTDTALECSFCNMVYHNTSQCLGAANIASSESLAEGGDWACVSCWDETCDSAKRELLRQRQQPRAKRRRRTKRAASQ